jgi:hypothetical protein
MALSYIKYSGDGATTNFAVPFAYIDKTHVHVLVSDVVTTFTWVNDSTIQISPAPAVGVLNVHIYRETPSLIPIVDFYDTDQDLQSLQILYVQQENTDTMADVLATEAALLSALAEADADAAAAAASAAAALASQTAAAASAAAALTAETNAETAETNAETAETNAETAQAAAEAAKVAAQAAQAAAEAAKTAAETAETNAETAETNAETAETNAETAETNAETAATNAAASAAAAATSETNAAASAAAAAASALTANLSENPIINPCMEIWQRGTSFLSAASGIYTTDRWAYSKSNAAVHDISQSTDVPTVAQAGVLFKTSVLIDCTTADAAVAAGDYVQFYQVIEGYNWRHFAERALTLSFWVKATKTGIYCLSLTNTGGDRTFLAEYTVNAADTWEKKTINISASPSAGTWDYGSGHGLIVRFCLVSGTTYQGSTGWSTGNFLATANQVNACDNTANNWRLTGVKMELGSTATDLRFRSFQDELMLCQRYYETRSATLWSGEVVNPQVYYHSQSFNTFKRASPTMTYTFIGQNGFAASAPATFSAEGQGFTSFKAANATVSGGFLHYSWVANAEL